jgi:hypothetical protein
MHRETVTQLTARLIVETQMDKIHWRRQCYEDSQRFHFRDIPYGGMVFTTEWNECRLQLYKIRLDGPYPGEKAVHSSSDPDYLFKVALDIVDENGEIEYILESVYAMVSLYRTVQAKCSPSLSKIEQSLEEQSKSKKH